MTGVIDESVEFEGDGFHNLDSDFAQLKDYFEKKGVDEYVLEIAKDLDADLNLLLNRIENIHDDEKWNQNIEVAYPEWLSTDSERESFQNLARQRLYVFAGNIVHFYRMGLTIEMNEEYPFYELLNEIYRTSDKAKNAVGYFYIGSHAPNPLTSRKQLDDYIRLKDKEGSLSKDLKEKREQGEDLTERWNELFKTLLTNRMGIESAVHFTGADVIRDQIIFQLIKPLLPDLPEDIVNTTSAKINGVQRIEDLLQLAEADSKFAHWIKFVISDMGVFMGDISQFYFYDMLSNGFSSIDARIQKILIQQKITSIEQ